jgi:hypothetical protein
MNLFDTGPIDATAFGVYVGSIVVRRAIAILDSGHRDSYLFAMMQVSP